MVTQDLMEMVESLIIHEKLIPEHFNKIVRDLAAMLETLFSKGEKGAILTKTINRKKKKTLRTLSYRMDVSLCSVVAELRPNAHWVNWTWNFTHM